MKTNLIFLFSFFNFFIFCQKNSKIINNESTLFQIENKSDIIEFIVFELDFKDKKPLLIYFQGSQSRPLYIQNSLGKLDVFGSGLNMLDIASISKKYRLVCISMPKTPVIVKTNQLSKSYFYDPNQDGFPEKDFLEADFLENYVERGNSVINFLKKQEWVDKKKITLFGHSQGTKVAARIASKRKDLFAVGLFSPNPFGRIDQYIREDRKNAESGKVSWEEADEEMNEQYNFYQKIMNDEGKTADLKSWKSFSQPQIDDWLNIKAKLYVAYGTHDLVSDLCDLVPLEFIRNKNRNLTLKRYLQKEHSFFEVKNDGNVDYENPNFGQVVNVFVEWTLTIKK